MEGLKKLENLIEGWLKPVPHLPNDWRKWLAHNSWWLVLVGVIISALAALGLIGAILTAMAFVGSVYSAFGLNPVAAYSGLWYTSIFVSFAFLVVTIVIEAMAISHLKLMHKKGWDLMFLVFLVSIVSAVLNVVLNLNSVSVIMTIIGNAIGIVIGAYFLFELRSYFKPAEKK